MENLLVILIVALSCVSIVRRFYKSSKKKGGDCGCGCSVCENKTTGSEPAENN